MSETATLCGMTSPEEGLKLVATVVKALAAARFKFPTTWVKHENEHRISQGSFNRVLRGVVVRPGTYRRVETVLDLPSGVLDDVLRGDRAAVAGRAFERNPDAKAVVLEAMWRPQQGPQSSTGR